MKKTIQTVIVVVILASMGIGYYYYLNNRQAPSTETAKLTEVQKVIETDLVDNYPKSPRGVVKDYNKFLTVLYAESFTDEEFEQMADQIRMLLDDELLALNERDKYLVSLREDVTNYKNRNKTIARSTVCDSDDIRYAEVEGHKVAYVTSYYFTQEGSNFARSYQEFVLRKDTDDGRWKILSYRLLIGD